MRISCHPLTIDPILELPEPGSLDNHTTTGRDARFRVTRSDQPQKRLLRYPFLQHILTTQNTTQIAIQRWSRTYSEDSSFGSRMILYGTTISGCKNMGIIRGLKCGTYLCLNVGSWSDLFLSRSSRMFSSRTITTYRQETSIVQIQSVRVSKPFRRVRIRAPYNLITLY